MSDGVRMLFATLICDRLIDLLCGGVYNGERWTNLYNGRILSEYWQNILTLWHNILPLAEFWHIILPLAEFWHNILPLAYYYANILPKFCQNSANFECIFLNEDITPSKPNWKKLYIYSSSIKIAFWIFYKYLAYRIVDRQKVAKWPFLLEKAISRSQFILWFHH